jgi:hypothetical protein
MNVSRTLGQSSFSIPHNSNEKAIVNVRRGDDVLRELGISYLDGLLLDLEGWESHALEGLSETLKTPPRWAIIECFEVALENAGSSRQALLSQIEAIGLRVDKAIDGDLICRRP